MSRYHIAAKTRNRLPLSIAPYCFLIQIVDSIMKASEDVGFFSVVNHGIPLEDISTGTAGGWRLAAGGWLGMTERRGTETLTVGFRYEIRYPIRYLIRKFPYKNSLSSHPSILQSNSHISNAGSIV